jgi:hypothetical protein
MSTVYVKRIGKFLDRVQEDHIPLSFYIAVDSLDNRKIVALDQASVNKVDIVTILEYVLSFLPSPTVEQLKQLSTETKVIVTDLAMAVIAIHRENFIKLPNARSILDIVDNKAELEWNSLQYRIDEWSKDLAEEATVDYAMYYSIPQVDTIIEQTPALNTSPVELLSQERSYPFTTNTSMVQMFDKAMTSFDVPFISIQNANKIFYKVHTAQGLSLDYYNTILERIGAPPLEGSMTFLLWKGGSKDATRPSKESMVRGEIKEGKIFLDFDIKGGVSYNINEKIGRTFGITLGQSISGKSRIQFMIEGVNFNYLAFQLMLETDEVIKNLLILNENISPGSSKNGSAYQFLILGADLPLPKQTPRLRIVAVNTEETKSVQIGMIYVEQSQMDYYRILASKIITRYTQLYQSILQRFPYAQWLTIQANVQKAKGRGREIALTKQRPDIFISGYARECQKKEQPTIIDKKDVAYYKAQTFERKGVIYNRQVMDFPPDNPTIHLVCLNEKQFPGLMENTLSNKDKFPFLPCCYNKPHGNFLEKYSGTGERRTKNKTPIKTNKAVYMGRLGKLPFRIEQILKSIMPDFKFYRMGTIKSPISLLHAYLYAIDDRPVPGNITYEQLMDDGREAEMISKAEMIRAYLKDPSLATLYPAKQEMYDSTIEQIRNYLNQEYLDADYIYRLLEENAAIPINIFVFSGSIEKNTNTGLPGELLIPRYKLFHSRLYRPERPTLILYKNWGSESNKLDYPQYELIVSADSEDNVQNVKFYPGTGVTEGLYELLRDVHQVKLMDNITSLDTPNYEKFLIEKGIPLFKQFIDTYGKTRCLRVGDSTRFFDIFIAPTQPMRPGTINETVASDSSLVLSVLGEPNGIADGGLWYDLEQYKNAMFVPVKTIANIKVIPSKATINIRDLVSTSLNSIGIESTDRMVKLSKISVIILQIVEWLYGIFDPDFTVSTYDDEEVANQINQFMDYFTLANADVDTVQFYDVTNVPFILPKYDTIEEALRYLRTIMPNAVINEPPTFVIMSDEMRKEIQYFLLNYLKHSRQEQREQYGFVYSRYTNVDDFVPRPNTVVFSDYNNIISWTKAVTNYEAKIPINTSILVWDPNREEPFIYNNYMIQNVIEHALEYAISVYDNWVKDRINLGLEVSASRDIRKFTVYSLNASHQLQVKTTLNPQAPGEPIPVFEFGPNRYAVMLSF